MKKLLLFCLLLFFIKNSSAQFTISNNHRYLLKNGKPFYWLGDTPAAVGVLANSL